MGKPFLFLDITKKNQPQPDHFKNENIDNYSYLDDHREEILDVVIFCHNVAHLVLFLNHQQ